MIEIKELQEKIFNYSFDVDKYNYIGEDQELIKTIKERTKTSYITVIKCPPGLGKTNFVCDKLDETIFFLSPTRALADEVSKKYVNENINGIFGENKNTFTYTNKSVGELSHNDSIVSTYASSKAVFNEIKDNFDILVVDEVHMMIRSLDYAYDHYLNVLHCIVNALQQNKKVILMSATPEVLISCYMDYKTAIDNDKICIIDIEPTRSKKYIDKLFIYKKFDVESLYSLIKKNSHKHGKQIVLLNNKDNIKKIIKSFQKDLIEYKWVESSNLFEALNDEGEMTSDIIIGTSVIECGLNFNDQNITDLYCIFDHTWLNGEWDIILQFMARARKSKPNMHIVYPTYSDFEYNLIEPFLEVPSIIYKVLNVYTKHLVDFSKCLLGYYKPGFIPKSVLKYGQAIVKYSNGNYDVNSNKSWHYLYNIYTKIKFDSILERIDFYETKEIVYSIDENEQLDKTQYIYQLLEEFYTYQLNIPQKKWKELFDEHGIEFKQMKSFVKNYPPYDIETDKHRKSGLYRMIKK